MLPRGPRNPTELPATTISSGHARAPSKDRPDILLRLRERRYATMLLHGACPRIVGGEREVVTAELVEVLSQESRCAGDGLLWVPRVDAEAAGCIWHELRDPLRPGGDRAVGFQPDSWLSIRRKTAGSMPAAWAARTASAP